MSDRAASARRYFRAYLRVAPLAHALWRAAEAEAISTAPLPAPLLDIGSGFGEFGSVFFQQPPEVGLDVSRSDLRVARRRAGYRNVVQADGRRLPFRDASFASVLSMSVLEHIDEAERVVPEAWRVLRPGGVFVFTTPAPEMGEMLFYPRMLGAMRLRPLGRAYGRMVDAVFHHVSLKPLEAWTAALERAGFRVREARHTVPPRLTAAFDLALPGALLSQVGRVLKGPRWVWRPPGSVWVWDRLLGPLVEEDNRDAGCNLFLWAEKP